MLWTELITKKSFGGETTCRAISELSAFSDSLNDDEDTEVVYIPDIQYSTAHYIPLTNRA